MIDKNRIQILTFRDEILDISELEEEYQVKLPPIYRSFLTVFVSDIGANYLYSKEDGHVTSFVNYIYLDEEKDEYTEDDDILSFMYFKKPEKLFKEGKDGDEWEDDSVYIAVHGYGGGLKLGMAEHNRDVIYLEETKLAENIFEFLHKIVPIVNEDSFPDLDLDKIVKKINKRDWEEI